jgi:hypothetical protein
MRLRANIACGGNCRDRARYAKHMKCACCRQRRVGVRGHYAEVSRGGARQLTRMGRDRFGLGRQPPGHGAGGEPIVAGPAVDRGMRPT